MNENGGLPGDGPFSRRVLLLDDDPVMLRILSTRLQALGMEVFACRELEAALAILDNIPMDAVVTDLCTSPLGGLDGTHLLRHMATHFPETDLIVLSAHASDSVRRLSFDVGASAFFEKPVDLGVLADRLLRGVSIPVEQAPGVIHDVESLDEFLASRPIHSVLQPIVSLQDGRRSHPVHGLECLARGPVHSMMKNPEILFEYATRKERLYETDLQCIAAGLAEARKMARGPRIFLNVQPRSMTNPEFTRAVRGLVEAAGFAPDDIVFELVEQQTILNPRAFASTVSQVRRHGFKVALDDFGVGFCNLNLLLDLRPDYVKLPRYFAKGVAEDFDKQEVVHAVRALVALLGKPVIMEGIETAEELDKVRHLGVEFGQGYFFSRPLRAEELSKLPALAAPVGLR
ncbi:MAG TPA: EAL domain-containing protein [Planctomycetota bacterium]|nr:EAL domain-containing protein [Planctomycetota bacterium]